MRSCASYVMRSLTWALNVAHSHRLSTLSLCLESLRNRTPSNLKLHHISKHPSKKMFLAGRWFHLANGVLCFSTPKHNGKSGTVFMEFYFNQSNGLRVLVMLSMTSTLLLGLVTSSSEATIYLFHNDHVCDDFNLTATLSNFLVRSNHLSIPQWSCYR